MNPTADEIITDLGGTAKVAEACRVKPPSVSEWRVRGIPGGHCPAIERFSKGKYRCEVVRPDLPWGRVADKSWSWHPRGRPVLEVAKETA